MRALSTRPGQLAKTAAKRAPSMFRATLVAAVLGLPVVGRVPVRAEIARAVDAGVLRDRLPAPLAASATAVLDGLPGLLDGRWAA